MQPLRNQFKPWARAVKHRLVYRSARRRAARRTVRDGSIAGAFGAPWPAFIIGCGRSGTTLLGEIFSTHPAVTYHFEPYHLWAAIEPTTDMINLYARVEPHCLMGETHATPDVIERFHRLFTIPFQASGGGRLIEKSPINAMRIGFLSAIASNARFVHIVRDGVEVARSINRIATTNRYRIAGRPRFNQWWGDGEIKWAALVRDGVEAGHFSDEVRLLPDHLRRGAYEWLVSLAEVNRRRSMIGERLFELTYDELTTRPSVTIHRLCAFLDIDCPGTWLQRAVGRVESARHNRGTALRLPPTMCEAFNAQQQHYGFAGRAEVIVPEDTIEPATPAASATRGGAVPRRPVQSR